MVYTLSGVRFPTVPSLHKSPAFTSNADRRNPSVSVFLKKHSVSRKIFAEKYPQLNNWRLLIQFQKMPWFSEYKKMREEIDKYEGGLEAFSRGYEKKGFTRSATGITYREWAPGAKWAALIGDFNNWNPNADVMTRNEFGIWEIFLPNNADGSPAIPHGPRVKIL